MESSSYFGPEDQAKQEEEQKKFIPPDYGPSDDDDDDDDDIIETVEEEDEGAKETKLDECLQSQEENKTENKDNMVTTPFGQPASTPSWGQSGNSGSTWGQSSGSTPWGSSGGSTWGTQKPSGTWGSSPSSNVPWGNSNQGQKEQINREKKVIFIDFLDCIVETYQSNGQPGLLPRDIYDLKPRFEVWQKLAAFNPEKVYSIIPVNLIPNTNGIAGWQQALGYFCCSLSAFLRVPYTSCQILAQSRVGQPKEDVMMSVIRNIPKEYIVSIGIYSGLYGQSNRDLIAANYCGVDHLDLNQLLNNMY